MTYISIDPVTAEEAVKALTSKGLEVSFNYQDMDAADHARAFTVAKAMKVDVLSDIHTAVTDAIKNGTTLEQFQKDLKPTLVKQGWWGKQEMIDPLTGEKKLVQLGSPRRLRTIYNTNLRASYAAGKWARVKDTAARVAEQNGGTVYIRYIAIDDKDTRPAHRNWSGTILPHDHPFWRTHYPPNGWGCRCTVQILTERQLKRLGYKVSADPDITTREWVNKRTGEITEVPDGIDPGWSHNVGVESTRAQAIKKYTDSLITAPPRIAAMALKNDPAIVQEIAENFGPFCDKVLSNDGKNQKERKVIGALQPRIVGKLADYGVEPKSAAISITDEQLWHMLRDTKAARNQTLPEHIIRRLPLEIANPKAVVYDTKDPALLYVIDSGRDDARDIGKIVLRINFKDKKKRDSGIEADKITNAIRTSEAIQTADLKGNKQYELMDGEL